MDVGRTRIDVMSEQYEVMVKGHVDSRYFAWCQPIAVTHNADGDTVLNVTLRDQAELHGLLAQIRDLSLPLLSLNAQPKDPVTNDFA